MSFSPDAVAILRGPSAAFGMALLAEMDFPDGIIRVWRGGFKLNAGGHDWIPLAGFASVGEIEGGVGLEARGVRLGLTRAAQSDEGTPPEIEVVEFLRALKADLDTVVAGRNITIFEQVLDVETLDPLGDPEALWTGVMSDIEMQVDATNAAGILNAEGPFAAPRGPLAAFLTDAEQQSRHPGDLICQFAAQISKQVINWTG